MKYFCLPREITELIQNFPPVKDAWREVDIYLKDGSVRHNVVVVGNEFYAMDENKHKYFEPAAISFVEAV
jgi:hypothetical protein